MAESGHELPLAVADGAGASRGERVRIGAARMIIKRRRHNPSPGLEALRYILPLSAHSLREGLRNFKKPATGQPYCVPYSMS